MELTKEALGGLVGLYDHWQDILDTAEEIEAFSGAAFDHVTEAEFLTTWQTGMVEAVGTLKGLDLSAIQTTLQQQISSMVAQAGGVLSKAIPDNLETLLDNLKDHVPSDIPQRDNILTAANLIRNNVSVEIRENIPVTSSSTTQPTAGTSSTQSTQSTQSTSGSSSANGATNLVDYLLDAAFPEFERYVGNAWSLYYRMQDILRVSNIQAVLEAELQPIRTMLTSRKTSTGDPLTAEALIGQIPAILRKLLTRAITMVEDFLSLLFEAIKLLVNSLKTVYSKLTSSPSSWPDSPLKTFVQQLGLEKMPGLATLPSLLISMVLVPIYKAANGERPTFSASIFQAEDSHKARCDRASASLGLGCWAFDTTEVGLGAFKVSPGYQMSSNWVARVFATARGILDITAFHLPESDDEPDDPPETDDEKYKKEIETAEAWVNFTKDVCLVGVPFLVDVVLYRDYRSKFKRLKVPTTTPATTTPTFWDESFWYKRWTEYRDSLTAYNWFNQISNTVAFVLEIVALGLGGRIVALERQEDASYDLRDHAAKMLGSSLSIIDGIVGMIDSWRDEHKNRSSRSLAIGGRMGVANEKLTAIVKQTAEAPTNYAYYWFVGGVPQTGSSTAEFTPTTTDPVTLAVKYEVAAERNRILYADSGPISVQITGSPRAGQKLLAKVSGASATLGALTYKWYKGTADLQSSTSNEYTVAIGDGSGLVKHNDQVSVAVTYQYTLPGVASPTTVSSCTSKPVTIVDTPGTLTLASSGTPATEAKVGETITATLTDTDGFDASAVTYTWKAAGVTFTPRPPTPPPPPPPPPPVTTATAACIVALGANKANGELRHGEAITVTATYTDKGGTQKTLTSRAIKIVRKADGKITGTKSGGNLVIELESADGIAEATASWTHSTSTGPAACSNPAKLDTKWTWTVAIGAISPAPTGIKVAVKYKDLGSATEYTLSKSVA